MTSLDSSPTSVDRVNADRLWSRLMTMAEVAATPNGGNNRQALSDDDAAGRALFLKWTTDAGCSHEMDEIGNLFVRRPGRDPAKPAVLIGSHLDTQPTGGRFDGIYGVLGGLEVIERLNDLNVVTEAPIDLVVWANEEGSRFPYSMMGSAVWAGKLPPAQALALTDVHGVAVGDELNRLGWAGTRPARPMPTAAAFELHIEQGPILESEGLQIGVVTGVQGFRWFTIELGGFPAHAGPTPMLGRRDPARAIARIVERVYAMVESYAPWGRGTFAQFGSEPVSPNTIPERLWCTLDLRHPELESLEQMDHAVRDIVAAEADALGVTSSIAVDNDSPPVAFDAGCIAAVEAATADLGFSRQRIVSGAGHDSCYVALRVPTSMIFVPCAGGLSHNEAESITKEQAEHGASVLLGAVRRMAAG
ncbi:Zn-dependent hydrolase [Dactylosporangium sucinum]|uniref:Zn-dependent hydrolase n=1 Tax=Dactylosporangium sucinum TaxID=1424081 RepID=A0A917TTI1_9ACTN|nr:Zn-dependent hydrolase [Dactylosporangium sucinum]GGM36868.1 Zn-dependent hydrolase [Dactylosporangium sucinum]